MLGPRPAVQRLRRTPVFSGNRHFPDYHLNRAVFIQAFAYNMHVIGKSKQILIKQKIELISQANTSQMGAVRFLTWLGQPLFGRVKPFADQVLTGMSALTTSARRYNRAHGRTEPGATRRHLGIAADIRRWVRGRARTAGWPTGSAIRPPGTWGGSPSIRCRISTWSVPSWCRSRC